VQEEALVELYLPFVHTEQLTARPRLKVPASQPPQVVAPVPFPVAEPPAHSRHLSVNETGAYRPASQLTQTLKLYTYWPAEHVSQLKRSSELNLPVAQLLHSFTESCLSAEVAWSLL
jgi:hypothetical protein